VSSGGDVIPARRHGNTVASPSASPVKGDLFSKLTEERFDRLCIRTYDRPHTSLFGSKDPQPARLHRKPVSAQDEASAMKDELQMRLVEIQAREKVAKRAKGATVPLPLNVSSPQDPPTRRHHNHRYM
jgi:hypothetical protein